LEAEQASTSLYNADYLKELQASTPSLPASVKTKLNTSSDDALLHEKFPTTMKATIDGIGIPDAGAILAAKKKREQMRKGFNIVEQDDGFISLNDGNDAEEEVTYLIYLTIKRILWIFTNFIFILEWRLSISERRGRFCR
jgi:GC-rich sequence DNA-binding factor